MKPQILINCQPEIEMMQKHILNELKTLKLSRDQIFEMQEKRLREMLSYAKTYSSWHRKRISHINIDKFTLDQLDQLPIMTKQDLMKNWDNIVTDKKITLSSASKFLMQKNGFDLFYNYHLFASGGSSGRRGLFLWSSKELTQILLATFRFAYRDIFMNSANEEEIIVASIASVKAVHMGAVVYPASIVPNMRAIILPADSPIEELIPTLNNAMPTYLTGYPSVITRLAVAAIKNDLKIIPKNLLLGSEPLLPHMRSTIQQAWPNANIMTLYACTDTGTNGVSCNYSKGNLHLSEDLMIIEAVDINNHVVGTGHKSNKILVTDLHHKSLPLFRYEIDDSITVLDEKCACGSNFKLIAPVQGRHEDDFIYFDNKITVIHLLFDDIIMKDPGVNEYQIFQTINGANILIVPNSFAMPSIPVIKRLLTKKLQKVLLIAPEIQIKIVEKLNRHPETGKLKRFVPL